MKTLKGVRKHPKVQQSFIKVPDALTLAQKQSLKRLQELHAVKETA